MATLGNGIVQIRSGPDYGPWKQKKPFGAGVHCLQCPGNVNVLSLMGPGRYMSNAGVSPHIAAGQKVIGEALGPDRWGAHVGSAGNSLLWGGEVTGYAEWSNAQWWDNSAAVLNQAKAVGLMWKFHGFDPADLKWGSLNELKEAKRRSDAGLQVEEPRLWIHWDVTKALGGTTHWDVGLGFLFEEFPGWAREWVTGAGTGGGSAGKPDTGGTPGGEAGAEADDFFEWRFAG